MKQFERAWNSSMVAICVLWFSSGCIGTQLHLHIGEKHYDAPPDTEQVVGLTALGVSDGDILSD